MQKSSQACEIPSRHSFIQFDQLPVMLTEKFRAITTSTKCVRYGFQQAPIHR